MGKDWVENEAIESGCQKYQEGVPDSVMPNIAQVPIAAGKFTTFSPQACLGLLPCGKYIPMYYK